MNRLFALLWLLSIGYIAGCASRTTDQAARLAAEASQEMAESRFQTAFKKMQEASALRPEVAEYHVGAGMAAVKIGRIDAANKHYSAAEVILSRQAARDPDRVDDHAFVLVLLGRPEEARRTLREGLQRFPDADMLRQLVASEESILEGARQYMISNVEPLLSPRGQ